MIRAQVGPSDTFLGRELEEGGSRFSLLRLP